MSDVLKKMGPQKGKRGITKKPKKKFIGLAAKAKRRKQVSESRLAQRTGISAEDRKLRELLKKLTGKTEFPKKKPKIDWDKLLPRLKKFKLKKKPLYKKEYGKKYREKYHQLLESVGDMKHGGKAKKKYGVVGKPTLKKGGKA